MHDDWCACCADRADQQSSPCTNRLRADRATIRQSCFVAVGVIGRKKFDDARQNAILLRAYVHAALPVAGIGRQHRLSRGRYRAACSTGLRRPERTGSVSRSGGRPAGAPASGPSRWRGASMPNIRMSRSAAIPACGWRCSITRRPITRATSGRSTCSCSDSSAAPQPPRPRAMPRCEARGGRPTRIREWILVIVSAERRTRRGARPCQCSYSIDTTHNAENRCRSEHDCC